MTSRASLDADARARVALLHARDRARAPTGVDGIDLVTNDVLGLRRDPRVVAAAVGALERAGVGAGGSRLLGGDDEAHRALETTFAAWQAEEAAVLFGSGSAANAGAVAGLAREGDLLVCDARNHGSLVDAVRLSSARRALVPRADPEAVDGALAGGPAGGRRFVVVESLHGMDGDRADLSGLAEVCRRRDAWLVVDEAHAVGLLGPRGAGLVAEAGVADVVAARTNPCGKALGGAGGVVTSSRAVAAWLVHASRAFAYTTALPPAIAAAVDAAIAIAAVERWRAERALAHAGRVARALAELGQRVGATGGAFVPWILGEDAAALDAAARLRARGFAVRAVRPPTVPEGTARVRLSLHADLLDGDLERLLEALRAVVAERAR